MTECHQDRAGDAFRHHGGDERLRDLAASLVETLGRTHSKVIDSEFTTRAKRGKAYLKLWACVSSLKSEQVFNCMVSLAN